MPPEQALHRTARGVFTQYNPVHETPEGAVLEAKECAIYKEGVLSPRRGFGRYGEQFQPDDILEFDGSLLGRDGTTIKYDSDGSGGWVAYDGTFSTPDSTVKLRWIQARTALYLGTSKGVYYTEDIDTEPIRAGLATALDIEFSAYYGDGSVGLFDGGDMAGYRVVWGRLTPYGTLQLGAPSMRHVYTHEWTAVTWTYSGGTVTVAHTGHGYTNGDTIQATDLSDAAAEPTGTITVTGADAYTYTPTGTPAASGTASVTKAGYSKIRFTCPDDLQAGDFWEVYRTTTVTSGDVGDEHKRVIRSVVNDYAVQAQPVTMARSTTTVTVTLTAHGFSTGDVVWISDPSDSELEEGPHEITVATADTFTYTTATSGTLSGETGYCLLKTVTHIDGLDDAFLADKLYTNPSRERITQANTRPPWAKAMCLWKNSLWFGNTKKEHYLDLQLASVANLVAGTSALTITDGTNTEVYTFASARDYQDKEFLLDSTSTTTAEKIRNTTENLVEMINRTSEYWYAWYTSGINDPPGYFTIEARELDADEFSVTANNAACGGEFEPDVPTTGTTLKSDSFRLLNGVYHSKQDQPHAVPDENFDENLGDPSKEILAMVPTRDSIIVIKEDGAFRISGDSDRTFTFKPLDLTIYGKAPETWRGIANSVVGLSTKGVVRITESGSQILSKSIEDQIDTLLAFSNIDTVSHAVAYESEGKYILAVPDEDTDTVAKTQWVFDVEGQVGPTSWHRWMTCMHVLFNEQRLYFGSGDDDDHIFRERKDSADTDYKDEELEATITAVDTYEDDTLGTCTRVTIDFPVTGTLNTSHTPRSGDLFRRTPSSLPYSEVRRAEEVAAGEYQLYLSHYFPGMTTGTGLLARSIQTQVTWHGEAAEAATVLKNFVALQLYGDTDLLQRPTIGFKSDMIDEWDEYEVDYSADDDNVIRLPVPQNHALARRLFIRLKQNCAEAPWSLLEKSLEYYRTSLQTSGLPV